MREQLSLEWISLQGEVLGLASMTSIDNGELTFLQDSASTFLIWRCVAHDDGSIIQLFPGAGSGLFFDVVFKRDASSLRRPVTLDALVPTENRLLQTLVAESMTQGQRSGTLESAPSSVWGADVDLLA